ncbi:MAG: CmcI family methyltransferase [Candidatus Paceibacterota bacterium]|jgi:cephalosporin hydroxylase
MDITSDITKFSDMADDDHYGSEYLGYSAQQNHLAYQIFADFIEKVKPSRILEIGTGGGGFTYFLSTVIRNLGLDCQLVSYDICEHPFYTELRVKGVDIKVQNIFDTDDCKQHIKDFVAQSGVTLVLCDGGNKKSEFTILSAIIKTGDYIMAHDYCENADKFYCDMFQKKWNWHEICDKDIEQACCDNHLIPYNKAAFDNVAWVCRTRI